MVEKFSAVFSSSAKKYISGLTVQEQASFAADIDVMKTGEIGKVQTKQLRGQVRELIVGYHRMSYFLHEHVLYFIEGWRKKTSKTPKRYIDFAIKTFKEIKG